jgi:hypothetical protein
VVLNHILATVINVSKIITAGEGLDDEYPRMHKTHGGGKWENRYWKQ